MCDTIEEIYNDVISNLILKNKIFIKEVIMEKKLTLSMKCESDSYKKPIIANITLLKKDREDKFLINKLYKKNNALEGKAKSYEKVIKTLKEEKEGKRGIGRKKRGCLS